MSSLKNKDSNSSGMVQEISKLKDELRDVRKKLQDTETQMDTLQEQIMDKIEKILKSEKEAKFATEKCEKMT